MLAGLTKGSLHMALVEAVPKARTKALAGRVSCHISCLWLFRCSTDGDSWWHVAGREPQPSKL